MDSNLNKQELIKSVISRIATGPDLSKDLSFEETKAVMLLILKGEISQVQQAIFFIALRMKRETMEENQGILAAIRELSDQKIANVENLIDIGDPYSGFDRSLPISSFLPPLLAELGLPTVIHSLQSISPKFGLTHFHISQELGLNPYISSDNAVKNIENPAIGWSYIDQSIFCQGLHNLVPIRDEFIKRSVLNTVETLTKPISGKQTHTILGYVHKPYPPIYANLANFSGFNTALLIRGVEGGVVPSLRQQGLVISYKGLEQQSIIEPKPIDLGINQKVRSITIDNKKISDMAKRCVELGTNAISGKQTGDSGIFYDGLVLTASMILWHTKKTNSLLEASEIVRETLNSGKSLNRIKL